MERWDLRAFYDSNPELPGKMNTRWGGFLEQVDQFDPYFFGISPREAARMDPQQRLLLEVAWEALEDAGQAPERLDGTRTGVFIGISNYDYGQLQFIDPKLSDPYAGTGGALSIAANRLSYVFGFRGPSMAIDTACSSSLVAVHLACQSLYNGECELALAGGVNVILSPAVTVNFTKAGFMAPDGRCKAFDARANGYVRGEGAGVVVLKPLSQALADGDPIYAVIRGSAVNQDGRTNGLTAPSPQAQEEVLFEAYRRAEVSPGQVQYVEAHGTGTALGDPIEAKALGTVLAVDRSPGNRCAVGSVKTNVGHLEAAAGIAGLIKVALSLKHRAIPASLHFQEPNPYIPFEKLPLRVPQTLERWPESPGPALAGVSSFGFGGTNAHVVLQGANGKGQKNEEQEHEVQTTERVAADHLPLAPCHLLPLSARSQEALKALARAYHEFLTSENSDTTRSLHDLCYTASVRRSHHDHRLALVGRSREEMARHVESFLKGEADSSVASGHRFSGQRSKLVFVFSGQGPQWPGMGRELLEQEPIFREALAQCDELLRQFANWSLLEKLNTEASRSCLDDTEIAQPAIFALQVALAALWRSWGILPDAVIGHSVGEAAAAYIAGVLSLEDAMRVVFHRGRLMQRATGQGKMAAVGLSWEEAKRMLVGYEDRLAVAAINSPISTVLSGAADALEEILQTLQKKEIPFRLLKVNYAFHSPQMESFQSELAQALQGLQPQPASLPIFSTATGRASNGRDFHAAYWGRQLREPVLFSAAIDGLMAEGYEVFLEISPHPVLSGSISQCLQQKGQGATVLPSLRRDQEERAVMLESLGALYALDYSVQWEKLYPTEGQHVRLPSYPWQRERCWIETEDSRMDTDPNRGQDFQSPSEKPKHPLLGRRLKDLAHLPGCRFWEIELDRRALPYLGEHVIQGAAVLPIAAYVEMALAASGEALGAGPHLLTAIEFQKILFLSENGARTVQVALSPGENGETTFHIYSRMGGQEQSEQDWSLHATGKISLHHEAPVISPVKHEIPTGAAGKPIDFALLFFASGEETASGDKYRLVIEAAKFADRHGFSSVWVPERHFAALGCLYPNPAVLHAALARETRRVRLRAGSVVLPLHNPIRIAEEWAMVDNLSGGRVELSFASGWHPNDFAFFPEKYADRHAEMFRGIEIIKKLWQGETIQVKSGDGKQIQVRTYPTPIQNQVPVWITAAGNPKTFAKAGEIGANLLTHLLDQDLETVAEKIALYREGRAKHGHDPDAGQVSLMLHAFIGENVDIVREQVRQPYCEYLKSNASLLKGLAFSRGREVDLEMLSAAERDELVNFVFEKFFFARSLLGTPETCLELIEKVAAIGVNEVACLLDFGMDTDLILENLPPLNKLKDRCSQVLVKGLRMPGESLFENIRDRCREEISGPEFYKKLQGYVIQYGSSFQGIERLWRRDGEALGQIRLPKGLELEADFYRIHPALLDACFQVLAAALPALPQARNGRIAEGETYLPVDLGSLRLHDRPRPEMKLFSHALLRPGAGGNAETFEGDVRILDEKEKIVIEASGLRLKQIERAVQRTGRENLGDLLYELQWQPKASPKTKDFSPERKAPWIIFVDKSGIGKKITSTLIARGQSCFLVSPAESYEASGHQIRINPNNLGEMQQLLEHITEQETLSYGGVIHLWSLDASPPEENGIASLEAAQALGTGSVLNLIQALVNTKNAKMPRLWLVTRGAQPAGSESTPLAVAQSPLWGLGRTCAIEHPELWGGIVDLDPQATVDEAASQLLSAIHGQDKEDQIAFRQGQRYVARLVRRDDVMATPVGGQNLSLRSDASYLITGGLGGLGFEVARWMAQKGARHLILLGRAKLPPRERWRQLEADGQMARQIARLRELEETGIEVHYAAVDVADEAQLTSFLKAFGREDHPPIKGVVHAAAVKGQSLIRALTRLDMAAVQEVMRPKMMGGWLLSQFFADAPPDFLVFFSSLDSILGSAGQANYAAAGAFLDALAHHLRAMGRPAFSINWGPVAETGFGASPEGLELYEYWETYGIKSITPKQLVETLEFLIFQNLPQMGVMNIDWRRLQHSYPQMAGLPWAAELMVREASVDTSTDTAAQIRAKFRQTLLAAEPGKRQQLMESHLREQAAGILRIPVSRLEVWQPLTSMGFDSLMAIEMKNRIQVETGVAVPVVRFLEGPTISNLAAIILEQLTAETSVPSTPLVEAISGNDWEEGEL
jgi:natural product biosynthesis luciferase-like monooxygenase protein